MKIKEQMEMFVNLAKVIQSIITNLNVLYTSGYPKDNDLTNKKLF